MKDDLHLVRGGASGALRAAGAQRIFCSQDSLDLGPSALEPVRHVGMRTRFWKEFERTLPHPKGVRRRAWAFKQESIGLVLWQGRKRPITLWVGGRWADVLFASQMAAAIVRHRTAAPVQAVTARGDLGLVSHANGRTLAIFTPEELKQLYLHRQPIRLRELKALATLWMSFVSGDLGALQRRFDSWGHLSALLSLPPDTTGLIPQVGVQRRLLLSAYDTRLLRMFRGGGWCNVISRISERETRDDFLSLMQNGDMFISMRIAQWAAHAPQLLEHRRVEPARSFMHSVEYRVTEEGVEVLEKGLADPRLAPPLQTGGYRAYSPDMKWALEAGISASRLVRWRSARASSAR